MSLAFAFRYRTFRSVLVGVCILLAPCPLLAAETVSLWGRWEHTFVARPSTSPDIDVSITLTAPSGRTLRIAGFWDGGLTWRVRFMPDELGTWRYVSRSVPDQQELTGSGEFSCIRAAERTSRFLVHGAVRVSTNRRYFEHADGTPFLWIGDTAWYGAILSRADDWETYLQDRAEKHFSVVHFNAVAPRNGVSADENGNISFLEPQYDVLTSRIHRYTSKFWALVGWPREEHITLNPLFYQRLDQRIDAVNRHGLLAAVVLTWGLRPVDSGNALPEDAVVRLIKYLEARYQGNHVVWILTGDADYTGTNGERWKRIGRAAFGSQPHAPVSTHPLGMAWPWDDFRAEGWLDFAVYQSGHGDDAAALRWIHSGPPSVTWRNSARPFINIEPPYEGHLGYQSHLPHTDYSTRRAIYWSILNAPTAGVSYGAHGVWSWHTAVGQPPTDHPTTGVARVWREAIHFPGSTQMRYLADFLGSIQWWTLRPYPDVLQARPDDTDPARHVSASRSDARDLAVIYLPVGGTVSIRPGALRSDLSATWFNPRSGAVLPAKESSRGYVSPDDRDWVLVFKPAPTE